MASLGAAHVTLRRSLAVMLVLFVASDFGVSGNVAVPAVFTPVRPYLRTRYASTWRISAGSSTRENTMTSATFQSLDSAALG